MPGVWRRRSVRNSIAGAQESNGAAASQRRGRSRLRRPLPRQRVGIDRTRCHLLRTHAHEKLGPGLHPFGALLAGVDVVVHLPPPLPMMVQYKAPGALRRAESPARLIRRCHESSVRRRICATIAVTHLPRDGQTWPSSCFQSA